MMVINNLERLSLEASKYQITSLMLKEKKSNPEDGGIVRRQLVVATDDKSKLLKGKSKFTFRLVKRWCFDSTLNFCLF